MKRSNKNKSDGKNKGQQRRDRGMQLAADAKSDRVAAGRLALLSALLRLPNHTGTIDDATDDDAMHAAFDDGGCWRGSVTRSLRKDGFIEAVDAGQSLRPSRHCGLRHVWRLVDPAAARRYVGLQQATTVKDSRQQKEAAE
ncbi:hypothetical protein [Neorhodopirellula pilleata]|uniref:Uncharacterized protein n=1 Tax=Neorhodopirellula pilleata TaxID=2714738 RepID=A0A5C5ZYU7_9BACT|nr:hypothetical protein [Neorhodopirellula pilleata]TWT92177.1 hypothetical protein Pla100_47130 [Neorhodopirellula pilleata]